MSTNYEYIRIMSQNHRRYFAW